jgi:hypothetical protein
LHSRIVLLAPLAFALACGRVGYDGASIWDGGIDAVTDPNPGSGGAPVGAGGATSTGGGTRSGGAGGTGTGGKPSTGGAGGKSTGGAGGAPAVCDQAQCPTSSCNIAKPFACCDKNTNACGCSWAPNFYCM